MSLNFKIAGMQFVPRNIREWDQFFRDRVLVVADDDSIETIQIKDGVVTLVKMADMATDSFIARDDVGVGIPEVLSALEAQIVLQANSRVTVTATSYTAGDERFIFVDDDAAGGPVTISLDAVANRVNHVYYIKKLGNTGHVTIDPNGSELIEFSSNLILSAKGNSATIIPDATAWFIV